jgi:thioredoxin reductase (NADPH)
MTDQARDLLIIGAGPAGLAAAIAAKQAGLDYEVIEKGTLVQSICDFPRNQIFFTTPELLEIGGLPFVTPYEKPTRLEALRYYRRVVEHFDLRVTLGEKVLEIRRGPGGFEVEGRQRAGAKSLRRATSVVVACGYYDHPNTLGVPGEDLPHVSHYYVEPYAYYRQRVVIVGGKNSAALAALDLYRNGALVDNSRDARADLHYADRSGGFSGKQNLGLSSPHPHHYCAGRLRVRLH